MVVVLGQEADAGLDVGDVRNARCCANLTWYGYCTATTRWFLAEVRAPRRWLEDTAECGLVVVDELRGMPKRAAVHTGYVSCRKRTAR